MLVNNKIDTLSLKLINLTYRLRWDAESAIKRRFLRRDIAYIRRVLYGEHPSRAKSRFQSKNLLKKYE